MVRETVRRTAADNVHLHKDSRGALREHIERIYALEGGRFSIVSSDMTKTDHARCRLVVRSPRLSTGRRQS
jgi:hypothetical protein